MDKNYPKCYFVDPFNHHQIKFHDNSIAFPGLLENMQWTGHVWLLLRENPQDMVESHLKRLNTAKNCSLLTSIPKECQVHTGTRFWSL